MSANAPECAGTTQRLPVTRAVAELLGCSVWRVRELVADGTLTPVRFGERGKFRFRVETSTG